MSNVMMHVDTGTSPYATEEPTAFPIPQTHSWWAEVAVSFPRIPPPFSALEVWPFGLYVLRDVDTIALRITQWKPASLCPVQIGALLITDRCIFQLR